MAFLDWSDSLSVGVADIDTQHKSLVKMTNDLYEAMSEGKAKDFLLELLGKLADYTVEHFGFEERLMDRYSYLQSSMHKAEHKEFVGKVSEFATGLKNGKILLSLDILEFLKSWLANHILQVDKKFGAFLNTKGVK